MPKQKILISIEKVGPIDPTLKTSTVIDAEDPQLQENGCWWNGAWYVQGNSICTVDNKRLVCGAGGQWLQQGTCYPHPTENE